MGWGGKEYDGYQRQSTSEVTRGACEIIKLYSQRQNFCPSGTLRQLD